MNNAVFVLDRPCNEPLKTYVRGSAEVESLLAEISRQQELEVEIPLIIGGKEIRTGNVRPVVMPHNHRHKLGVFHKAGPDEVALAIESALRAREQWADLPWEERAAICLRAAELISRKYRDLINAASILGQSKNIQQAEIDSACETIDFLRFNAYFASRIYQEQPFSSMGILNKMEYRPLEGFVYAITPFNFTAIAGNLNMAPVVMGNVTVWKPATASILSSYYLMKIFQEAGLPEGVINFLPGDGGTISSGIMNHRDLAGIHFTGSNATFYGLWQQITENLPHYRSYPRIVGETGGKGFIFAHPSASLEELAVAIVLGAFEYQGQKCSAASRAYIPRSLWPSLKERLCDLVGQIEMGNPGNPRNLMGAVIDEKSYDFIMGHLERARASGDVEIITGGSGDKSKGYFIEPTILRCRDPQYVTMETELFGPVMSLYVYDDEKYLETLDICNNTSVYGLTGSVFSNDRYACMQAIQHLRYAAGNFYINDRPTGAMVGQQPFGGGRASGTNDKAGGIQNLLRWVTPRVIKENLIPANTIFYPHMQ